jgi:hypothetical protein
MRSDLGPRFGKNVCVGPILSDNAAPPAAVVVDVDAVRGVREILPSYGIRVVTFLSKDLTRMYVEAGFGLVYLHAICARTCVQADLNQLVVLIEISCIQLIGHKIIVD